MRWKAILSAIGALTVCAGGCALQRQAGPPPPSALPAPASVPDPTAANCREAVQAAQTLAEALPAGDLSRRAAESFLVQARVEAGNGEYDDCLEFATRATVEVREHRHRLNPGESLDVRPGR